MRHFKSSAVLSIAALSTCSLAALRVPIARIVPRHSESKRLSERVTESLFHNASVGGGTYSATIEVGEPPQSVQLAVDTGSSDLWVLSTTTDLCSNETYQAERADGCVTPFNPTNSLSFKTVQDKVGLFSIIYADHKASRGDFIQETVLVGEHTMKEVQMGMSLFSNQSMGLMGIGYTVNEARNRPGSYNPKTGEPIAPFTYPTIIDELVKNNVINIAAYSMYLDDLNSSIGSILFGGLDTDKFHGDLQELNVVPEPQDDGTFLYRELAVNLTGLALANSGSNKTAPLSVPVVVDSGSAFSLLPSGILPELASVLSGLVVKNFVGLDCDIVTNQPSITIDFSFTTTSGGTAKISVSLKEMVLPVSILGLTNEALAAELGGIPIPFKNVCVLGIMGASAPPYILGDTFMRSTYVVYDLANNLIGIAPTNFESSNSNIVNFEADQTKLPQVSGVPISSTVIPSTVTPTTSPTTTQSAPTGTKTGAGNRSAGGLSSLTVMGGFVAAAYFLCN